MTTITAGISEAVILWAITRRDGLFSLCSPFCTHRVTKRVSFCFGIHEWSTQLLNGVIPGLIASYVLIAYMADLGIDLLQETNVTKPLPCSDAAGFDTAGATQK